jgi:microcystin-dependent protein
MKRKKLSFFGIFAVSVAALMVNIGWGFETNKNMVVDGDLLVRGTLTANITAFFPTGGIIMWSGELSNIPDGWALCDGQNNTPNLSGRFVVGYNAGHPDYATIGATGGTDSLALTTQNLPRHSHTASAANNGNHQHSIPGTDDNGGWNAGRIESTDRYRWSDAAWTNYGGEHSHNITIAETGSSEAFDNRSAYYVLAYIIKL